MSSNTNSNRIYKDFSFLLLNKNMNKNMNTNYNKHK